jgi:hypothetical protein
MTGVAGITADANSLINYARNSAQRYALSYSDDIPVEQLAQSLCDLKQGYTQYGGELSCSENGWWLVSTSFFLFSKVFVLLECHFYTLATTLTTPFSSTIQIHPEITLAGKLPVSVVTTGPRQVC